MLHTLVAPLARILPPTIHPMVVHFPIAMLYITLVVDVIGWVAYPDRDRFYARAGFWLLTGSCAAIIAAMVAGVISEQSIHLTPTTAAMLSQHQHYAILTGLFAGAAWILRLLTAYGRRSGEGWSVLGSGRGRQSLLATACVLGAVVFVSLTGSVGGSMVYNHGLGVHSGAVTTTHAPHAKA